VAVSDNWQEQEAAGVQGRYGATCEGTRQLVGLSAAAAYADVSTRTLRRYIAQGRLTGYRVGPRLVKVDLSELDQLAHPILTTRGPG
jgi:excisionase family DNA binding protein